MEQSGLPYLIGLTRLGITSLSYIRGPLRRLGSFEAIWRVDKAELCSAGLRPSLAEVLAARRSSVDLAAELALLEKHRITVIAWSRSCW